MNSRARERLQQEDRQDAITREQVRLAMRQLPSLQAASFLVALVLAYLVRGIVPAANIVLRLAPVLAVVGCRTVRYRRFTRLGDGSFDGPAWRNTFPFLFLLSGTFWGLSALLLFPPGHPGLISLIILVMASLAASTTVSYASLRLSPLAWAGPALLLYAVRCFRIGTVYGTAAGFLVLLCLATVIVSSFKHHRSVTPEDRAPAAPEDGGPREQCLHLTKAGFSPIVALLIGRGVSVPVHRHSFTGRARRATYRVPRHAGEESRPMTVTCPACGLSKDIGPLRVPSGGTTAACPRCGFRFEVMPEHAEARRGRRRWALLPAVVAGIAAVLLLSHDGKLDKDYFLEPGTWQGEMTYLGKQYPFELVIESARDGRLSGYMDWVGSSPRYRLALQGTYRGNHLVFEEYAFLERQGTTGLNERKDVYIIGNEMVGTDKNGTAEFHALQRLSAPF